MVESQARVQPNLRSERPSSGGYFDQIHFPSNRNTSFASPGFSSAFPAGADDNENITTPTLTSVQSIPSNSHNTTPQNSVAIHASMDMSDQSHGDQSRSGPTRRRSRSQAINPTRSSTSRTPQSPSAHGYPSSSTTADHRHPTAFQGPTTPYANPTSVQYSHRPDMLTQYTMSTPPGSMGIAHSPSYVFPPTFHPSMDHSQSLHGSYTSMMQSPPMYQFPANTVDHSASSVPPYSGTRSPSMFASTTVNPQPPPGSAPHLLTNQQQGTTISGAYMNTGSFQTMGYPPASPYPYPSAMFPARYAPTSFSRPYPQTTESEPQGTWFYLPHPSSLPSSQQYDSNPSYPTHFPVHFAQMGRSRVENQFAVATSSQHATQQYSMPPNPTYRPHFSQTHTPTSPDGHQPSGQGPQTAHQPPSTPTVSSGSERLPSGDRAVLRRPYHPNPPAHRSEWVMWAGNVPSDATHDELWKFFNQLPSDSTSEVYHSGVLSIFLISRSSCAFVNYDTEVTLLAAINRFNGVPLRSHDPRCPRMVCRVRKKDDDLKAGVGGQRGMGMHTRWIKHQKGKAKETSADQIEASTASDPSLSPSASVSERLTYAISSISLSSDEDGKPPGKQSSGSGSFTSTNSGFLVRYFPKRFFILKSLTQDDLDLSVERGVWATQKHNEGILDQAYRTSKDVFLIFSVNKSGEFYGYARMSGPVRRGEQTVAWASRRSEPSGPRGNLPSSGGPAFLASDGRQVDTSPLPLHSPLSPAGDFPGQRDDHYATAPPLLGKRYHLPTVETPGATYSLDPRYHMLEVQPSSSRFELDDSAPARAVRRRQAAKSRSGAQELDGEGSPEPDHSEEQLVGPSRQENWGDCFSVEWVTTNRLPFHRTRHLRNPWNHDREVKVSRDGTELEPSVGQRLVDEWEKLADLTVPLASSSGASGSGKPSGGKKASKQPQTSNSMALPSSST
ncbi:hypothetical protein CVT24_003702 [Panaeolus cyanescens]|uniref:YTH domain-containing protein n=1 Tax=Panaeolus cyanescens TaxID=181874 RepID=A0A409YXM1_9AGAR|nr:hypothetical protein CVT24_003702 [Panaeolus cyanescens]